MPATATDPAQIARRLSERLEEKGLGYEDFHRRVRDVSGGARGTSYGSVWAYANGRVSEPRPKVVEAMADVLGVRYEWLMTGRGPRTLTEAARAEVEPESAPEPGRPEIDRIAGLIRAMEREEERVSARSPRHDRVIQALVIDLLESDGRGLDRYAEGEVREAVRLVSWLLTFPLRAVGSERMTPEARQAYLLTVAGAIRMALPPAPEGRPQNTLSRLRRLRALTRLEEPAEAFETGPSASAAPH